MALPHFEVLSGSVNGSNVDFYTSIPFRAGSFAGFTNGQLAKQGNADGWEEVDPYTGHVRWNSAPLPGDVIQGFFVDYSISSGEMVCNLVGRIEKASSPVGIVEASSVPTGTIRSIPFAVARIHVC